MPFLDMPSDWSDAFLTGAITIAVCFDRGSRYERDCNRRNRQGIGRQMIRLGGTVGTNPLSSAN